MAKLESSFTWDDAPKPYYQDDHVTIYHGDWRDVLPHVEADVLVTDPPYGIDYRTPGPGGRSAYRPYGVKSIAGDKDTSERDAVIDAWNGPAMVFGSTVGATVPANAVHVLTWAKPPDSGLQGAKAGFRRDTEWIFLLGEWPARRPLRSSVLRTKQGINSYLIRGGHPHTKPVGLMCELLEACPPGVILDPFMGSGSTLRAAKDLGRKAIGIELEEKYCKLAADRMRQEGIFG